jgi:hypothetical protein
MNHWKRFRDRLFALVTSPGFKDMDTSEQDRLYEEIARAGRLERLAEGLLPRSLPPHRFYAATVRWRR